MKLSPDYDSQHLVRTTLAAASFVLLAAGCGGGTKAEEAPTPAATAAAPTASPTPVALPYTKNPECKPFPVYAQNRWLPYGTIIRRSPSILADKIGSYGPNEVIAVDGEFTGTEDVYADNPEPWNSRDWFHVANNGGGYVTWAGVRATPTENDPTLKADGGPQAPEPAECRTAPPQ
ncbi:MAG: hypothetical protein JWN38_393 [Candidatus Saccharibacteria bacterium]|nr:hypothetical protein [Candidatus Saccharibacteria bacterium]